MKLSIPNIYFFKYARLIFAKKTVEATVLLFWIHALVKLLFFLRCARTELFFDKLLESDKLKDNTDNAIQICICSPTGKLVRHRQCSPTSGYCVPQTQFEKPHSVSTVTLIMIQHAGYPSKHCPWAQNPVFSKLQLQYRSPKIRVVKLYMRRK